MYDIINPYCSILRDNSPKYDFSRFLYKPSKVRDAFDNMLNRVEFFRQRIKLSGVVAE